MSDTDDEDDGIDRRRLVRILIIVAIAIPILIEAVTFAGIISHSFGDGGGNAETPTAVPDGVGVDDELLEETAESETVETAYVRAMEEEWQFVLTVQVANTGEEPYAVRLSEVTSKEGTTVSGFSATGSIEPGKTANVTGAWALPESERPESIKVVVARGADPVSTTQYTVTLKPVPVRR